MPKLLASLFLALAVVLVFQAAPARAGPLWETLPAPAALPRPDASGLVDHDRARIYYAAFGRGRPVILLHGGLANGEYWGDQVPALVAAGYRVILIDSRGHGRSSRDSRPFTYELMASDVVAVMDALKLKSAPVVGWSDGAIISLVMALKYPDRITRAFAFAANMDPGGADLSVADRSTFTRFKAGAPGDYARLSPTPAGYADFSAAINRMWETEPNYSAADLAGIHTPVAIVDGDHDEAIRAEHTRYLARAVPGARLIILKNTSHFAMLQDPARFNAAVLGFLGGR